MAILNFSNLDQDTQETKTFDKGPKVVLPEGSRVTGKIFYLVEKENNRGDGKYLSIGMSVDGHNCTVFDILNIENRNENTVKYALRNIQRILSFNNVSSTGNFDSSDLEGMNVSLVLGVRANFKTKEEENFVKFYNTTASNLSKNIEAKPASSNATKPTSSSSAIRFDEEDAFSSVPKKKQDWGIQRETEEQIPF